MKHGTVAVLTSGGSVEITTYRIDGEYLDNRHPSKSSVHRRFDRGSGAQRFHHERHRLSPERRIAGPF